MYRNNETRGRIEQETKTKEETLAKRRQKASIGHASPATLSALIFLSLRFPGTRRLKNDSESNPPFFHISLV